LQQRRLVLELSTLARSGGQAVGIVRVVREIAAWAHAHRQDVCFALLDRRDAAPRQIRAEWTEQLLRGGALVDLSRQQRPQSERRPLRDRLPTAMREPALWLRNPRRRAFMLLERRRLTARSNALRRWIESLQGPLLSPRFRHELTDPQGGRRTLLPYDMAIGPAIDMTPQDILICLGSDWGDIDVRSLARLKAQRGFQIAIVIYDLIPLLYPQFYEPKNLVAFRLFFHAAIPLGDLVMFISRRSEQDAQDYARANGLALSKTYVFDLGADPPREQQGRLPRGLAPGRYVLFVSTIEPRKGHRLLFEVWKRLRAEQVPQRHGFKLVFVGRRGWLVDVLLRELDAYTREDDSLLIMAGVPDTTLAALYRDAAFCLYPSLYEGYGLPIVEAFRYGRAVISSNGGALPEVVGEFSPCLDPSDQNAWHDMLRRWIENPAERRPFEDAIRTKFRHPTWPQAAEKFFTVIDEEFG